MHLHGYAAAVIHYRDAVIFIDGYIDLCTVTGEGLVNGVVNNLINKMMQATNTYITNIHGGPFPYCLQSFKYLDTVS